jgi:BASS family bile acid:Na+ symporter
MISLTFLNNTLVVVFSSQFFGPIEPIVNTVYMVPFFALIVPLRAYQKFLLKRSAAGDASATEIAASGAAHRDSW